MHINTLIQDIYKQIQLKDGWFDLNAAMQLGADVAQGLQNLSHPYQPRLRLSQMGPRCPRALWHSINKPEDNEKLPPWAEIKYTYGHIIEALALTLARAAGHEVTGEQDELNVDGVCGHRDAVIDGCIVDVKSASSYSFNKFRDGSIKDDDQFGYLDQLDGYLVGSLEDPLVRVKDRAYLLAIDKSLGHMVLYEHRLREQSIRSRIASYKSIVAASEAPPCTCGTVPDGRSGNIKLDTKASYSLQKYSCFPQLRTFLYATGPVYLTKVVRKPNVPEINKDGRLVYRAD